MQWDHVRFFLALYRQHTLSDAARELGVNHATVSRRIDAMEDGLGAALFIKTPDGYFLTPFGESLLPAALDAEDAFERLALVVRNADDSPSGIVRVATSQLFARHLVLPVAAELRELHPGIVIDVLEGTRFLDLARQEADIAVRLQLSHDVVAASDVRVRYLGMVGWALFGPRQATRGRADAPIPVATYDDEAPGKVGDEWLAERSDRVEVVMQTSSMYTATLAIEQGLAAAFIPTTRAKYLGFEQLSDIAMRTHAYAAIHPDLRNNARIRIVFEHLVDYASRHPQLFDEPA